MCYRTDARLPAGVSNAPMTYMADGKQYIIIAIRTDNGSEYRAFALPG